MLALVCVVVGTTVVVRCRHDEQVVEVGVPANATSVDGRLTWGIVDGAICCGPEKNLFACVAMICACLAICAGEEGGEALDSCLLVFG